MKKLFKTLFMVFLTMNSVAQNLKILGDWRSVIITRVDTTTTGMDEINLHRFDYTSGLKELDNNYIQYSKLGPSDSQYEPVFIKITKENDFFWLSFEGKSNFLRKISYVPRKNIYSIAKDNLTRVALVVEYDEKKQHLLLYDEKKEITMFEFERK